MLLGVDVGGTFTDAVVALDGRLVTAKAPTTPFDQSEGVIDAVAIRRHRGRTTWVWEVEMYDGEGRLCTLTRMTVAVRPRG